jgi:hypothetical protein
MPTIHSASAAGSLCGLLLSALLPAPAVAIGYYNLPGNICQWCGYGMGAGYHAPMVLGPPSVTGALSHNTQRLWRAPAPPCSSFSYDPSGGDAMTEPTMLDPTRTPSPELLPVPPAATTPAAYRVPFRY